MLKSIGPNNLLETVRNAKKVVMLKDGLLEEVIKSVTPALTSGSLGFMVERSCRRRAHRGWSP